MNNKEQEVVKKILLTPIKPEKETEIKWVSEGIASSQRYYSVFDCDMSDLAIGFYRILYDKDIINKAGRLVDREFAGDTMCSFNTIANRVPGAGKTKNQRTSFEKWPAYLQDYSKSYHCLANFWLLPLQIGRKSAKEYNGECKKKKWGRNSDYTDRFLLLLKQDFDSFMKEYSRYGECFSDFKSFAKEHFLSGEENYVSKAMEVNLFSIKETSEGIVESNEKPEIIIESMMNRIRARAEAIAQSEKCNELYKWMVELGLTMEDNNDRI